MKLWTVTLHPLTPTSSDGSKTHQHDKTLSVANINPARAWLTDLLPSLVMLSRQSTTLLARSVQRYNQLFKLSRQLASLPPAAPHGLRHGGASADALLTGEHRVDDLVMAKRGRWSSLTTVQIYRRPARYMRKLELLSQSQLSLTNTAPLATTAAVRKAARLK